MLLILRNGLLIRSLKILNNSKEYGQLTMMCTKKCFPNYRLSFTQNMHTRMLCIHK